MKHFFYVGLVSISFSAIGQTIEVPAGTPLTVQGNLNLPAGFSIQYNSQNYIQAPVVGSNNTYLGLGAGSSAGGTQNTFLGYQAGYATTSTANTFMGYRAGANNTSGQFNSFIGVQAGQANTTGSSNYFFGTNSGATNSTGSGNYFLGDNSGGGNTSGSFNIYIGANSGNGSGVNGDNNLAIGFEAGKTNQSGVNNTFIGFRADAGAGSLSNATAIGNNAKVTASNSLVLGSGANVGIGTTAPGTKLEIVSATVGSSGLRLTNLTTSNPGTIATATRFLTVNAQGDVVLGSTTGARLGAEGEGNWSLAGANLINTNAGGIIIGSGISQTPAGYKLYVADGILAEKVKVAVRSTAEWSDKVFEPGYQLQALSAVAGYIKANKHLPGVPSAEQVVKEGMDVAKMNAKLLEKIEELTLYLMEQHNELKAVRAQNRRMQQHLNRLSHAKASH